MLDAHWRALARRSLLLPPRVDHRHGGRGAAARPTTLPLPDGSDRYLVDEPTLLALTAELGGALLDPLKTTVVQDQRSMTTWVVRKPALSPKP